MFYLSGDTTGGVWCCDWCKVFNLLCAGNGKWACTVADIGMYDGYYWLFDVYDWIVGRCIGSESEDFAGDAVSGEADGV